MSTPSAELTRLLQPLVAESGLVLEDVQVTTVGRRRLVRVVVDLPEDEVGSVDLDRVADVSRVVSERLDESDALGAGPYALEVTTPGVDRPLTERRHFRRARTRLVRLQRHHGPEVLGRLVDVDGDGPVLDVDGTRQHVAWDEVRTGSVQVEFRRVVEEPEQPDVPEGTGTDAPDDAATAGTESEEHP